MTLFNPILKGGKPLAAWLGLALALCLMPGPAWWASQIDKDDPKSPVETITPATSQHDTGGSVMAWCEQNKTAKQWSVHFILMCGAAWSIACRATSSRKGLFSAGISALSVAGITAVTIEGLQELLPDSFERGFSAGDIWISLLGGSLGTGIGLCICLWINFSRRPSLRPDYNRLGK